MLSNNNITKLLGLEDVIVKNIEQNISTKTIYVEMKLQEHECPCCKKTTTYVHDYRIQKIKDIPAFGMNTIFMLRKRRYVCKECGKKFYENIDFLPKYHRTTNRLAMYIIDKLREERSFSSVAREVNLSVTTVIRIFDTVNYTMPQKPPTVLAIDEFKGNTDNEKYQCILTDPATGIVLDILPSRRTSYLISYMKKWTLKDRQAVKYFVSDMWQAYTDLSSIFLKSSTQIIDKYHFVRQIIWAFEAVRKREQKKYGKQSRLCFKNSKRILTKRFHKLKDWQKERVNAMLYISHDLCIAHKLKESFYKILDCDNRQTARNMMNSWIYSAQDSGLEEFNKCSNTMINWQTGILNSFDVPYTNGFTEGCNNKIKVLKRNAYGYRNFKRFRNRILHIFDYKRQQSTKEKAVA